MNTRNCTKCGEAYSAWTGSKEFCGGLRCSKVEVTTTARIVGLRRGNWRRSSLDINLAARA